MIESTHSFYFAKNTVVYKALLVQRKGGKIAYKIFTVDVVSIYAFVSNLTIVTFSKVMDWHHLGAYGLSYSMGRLAQLGGKV